MTNRNVLVVGSASDCDIRVADEYVSAHHALIARTPAGFMVEDLGSTNGTWIVRNRKLVKVNEPTLLLPTDRVRVGRSELPWTSEQ